MGALVCRRPKDKQQPTFGQVMMSMAARDIATKMGWSHTHSGILISSEYSTIAREGEN